MDAAALEVFRNLLAGVAEEMGLTLGRAAYSPNIKERRDFSCAYFDPEGRIAAQAAHIPVHLGSMPLAVREAIRRVAPKRGDVVVLNDPFLGGTHLPDITMVSPVYADGSLLGYLATRAHHADVGGTAPGSMAIAHELVQEGLIIPPLKLVEEGKFNQALLDVICANVRTPRERRADLDAQLGAHRVGERAIRELAGRLGWEEMFRRIDELLNYSERLTRLALEEIHDGTYRCEDWLDDDGFGTKDILLKVTVRVKGGSVAIDFSGTSPEVAGPLNCPLAVTLSAVYYALRCLTGPDIPTNEGCYRPVQVEAPEGCLVNARPPRAVAGGNVETSQRIVDVLLGALAPALPLKVPAASSGSMNNLTVGGTDPATGEPFTYYETIGGGMGARPNGDGMNGVHTHMTNTLNTPAEALEYAYPLRVRRYELIEGSGGEGRYRGGMGIRRQTEFLAPARVSLITERRTHVPYGLAGGSPGRAGRNLLIREGQLIELTGKTELEAQEGDLLSIETPGGGGWGKTNKS